MLKPIRETSQEYLDYIRGNKCLICFESAEPHHLKSVGSGGSDYTAVPLCRVHHTEWHQLGDGRFHEKYGINLWKEAFFIFQLWRKNDDSS